MVRLARARVAFALLLANVTAALGQTIVLDTFNLGGTTGAVVSGSSWSGQTTQNTTSLTVGGTATNVNGWGATGLALNATAATYLRITVQQNSGNAANAVKAQFEDSSVNTAVFSVPTTALATGVLTQVQILVGTWAGGFDPASIASWSIGGGGIGSTALRMTFEHLELGPGLLALNGGTILTAGNQNYPTAQTLGGTTTLNNTGSNGTAVTFGSTVNGAHGLTINTAGPVTFSGAVGTTTALASLTTDAGGITAINGGEVRTSGAQIYSGAVTLGANTVFRSTGGGAITFLAALTSNNHSLTVNTSGSSSLVTANGVTAFTKDGSGTLTLTGQSTYTGTTTVNAGTLALGLNQALPAASRLALAGGTLALQAHTQSLGLLSITASSTINFGGVGGTLVFANSSAEPWTGTLTLTDYNTH